MSNIDFSKVEQYHPFKGLPDSEIMSSAFWLDREMEHEARYSGTYMNPDYHYMGLEFDEHLKELEKRGYDYKTVKEYIDKRKLVEKLKQ